MTLEVFEITYKMVLSGTHMLVTPEAPSPPEQLDRGSPSRRCATATRSAASELEVANGPIPPPVAPARSARVESEAHVAQT